MKRIEISWEELGDNAQRTSIDAYDENGSSLTLTEVVGMLYRAAYRVSAQGEKPPETYTEGTPSEGE